ncbi:MAG: aminodeoxychorismate/anthranilate synthase component II [Lentisphaeria bacterium]|nr:aminodeoxychorismate/anthranilate synthase component II [Lentisphaeria bacterium]
MFLMIDNYDSFTYNLVQYFQILGVEMQVRRNDSITVDEALHSGAEAIVLSPGPGRPENAGILIDLVRQAGNMPLLGVCLGHQAIGYAFGAKIVPAQRLMHGKVSAVTHDGHGLFEGLENPFQAVRYHSLAVDKTTLPECLIPTASSEDGELMGIRHRTRLIEGIQYHPESVLTQSGKRQLRNFIRMVKKYREAHVGEFASC